VVGTLPWHLIIFFQFFLCNAFCPCVSPKKGIQNVLEGPQISRYLRPWYLCALRVLQGLEISIYLRGFHIFLHSGMCKIMLKYIYLSCTWTGNGHPSVISDFFLFGNSFPNFNLKNLIWNLHKGFFHEINCQNLLLIKKWASHAWYGTLGMAISSPIELTFLCYNFLCKTICALAVGLWWPCLFVHLLMKPCQTL
jgi:hypothetical protein